MRKTGYLGEGGFMMRNNLYGMNVERTVLGVLIEGGDTHVEGGALQIYR